FPFGEIGDFCHGWQQFLRDDERFAVWQFVSYVVSLRMKRYRQVRRQCPGSRGPDDNKNFLALQRWIEGAPIFGYRKFHINGWRTMLGVLNLGVSKRSLARPAPVHRLESAINQSTFVKFPIHASNGGLIRVAHG